MASKKTVRRAPKPYTAVYDRDESGAWVVRVTGLSGCHTYGRSIAQVRERLREAFGLCFDDDAAAERAWATVVHDLKMPQGAKKAVQAYRAAREKSALAERDASERSRTAVRMLVQELGLSTRDAAEALGLSQQRVAQLTQG